MRTSSKLARVLVGVAITATFALAAPGRIVKPLPSSLDRLAEATLVEVRDAGGRTFTSGKFSPIRETEEGVKRTAMLEGSGVEANGKAEIELVKGGGELMTREIGVSLVGLVPVSKYDLLVDGVDVLSFTSSENGKMDITLSTNVR